MQIFQIAGRQAVECSRTRRRFSPFAVPVGECKGLAETFTDASAHRERRWNIVFVRVLALLPPTKVAVGQNRLGVTAVETKELRRLEEKPIWNRGHVDPIISPHVIPM